MPIEVVNGHVSPIRREEEKVSTFSLVLAQNASSLWGEKGGKGGRKVKSQTHTESHILHVSLRFALVIFIPREPEAH
jgi:hypothetical protein